MTGFGRGENIDDNRQFAVEIKSVNHRYNDIIVKMPKHLSYLQDNIKKLIKTKIKRGRIEVYIHLININETEFDVKPNNCLAKSYINALNNLCDEFNLKKEFSIDLLVGFPEILKLEKIKQDEDEIWICLEKALEIALDKMIEMRTNEGKQLAYDIENRGKKINNLINEIEKRAPEVVLEYKDKLKERIGKLLLDEYEIDETKLANEVAFYADKSNITEEIVRLYSHIEQLNKTIQSNIPVGRKLDFLVQEMNREINTIGSKAGDTVIRNNVIEVKSELEKIREQIQNIE